MVKHTRGHKHNKKRHTRRRYKKRGGYDIETNSETNMSIAPLIRDSSVSNISKQSIGNHIRNVVPYARDMANKATDTFKNILSMVTPSEEDDKETFETTTQHREIPTASLIGGRRRRKYTNKRSKTRRRKDSKKRSKTRRRR